MDMAFIFARDFQCVVYYGSVVMIHMLFCSSLFIEKTFSSQKTSDPLFHGQSTLSKFFGNTMVVFH